MLAAIIVLTILGFSLGGLLGIVAKALAVEDANPLLKEVESLLPGSQCGQCGFAGCGPAAQAIVSGDALVTCCPPGGRSLSEALASLLDIDLDSLGEPAAPVLAKIEETRCVGCTRCIKACPTDAIVGASKQLHVVISSACTGCSKCKDACPENCIHMQPESADLNNWHWPKPEAA